MRPKDLRECLPSNSDLLRRPKTAPANSSKTQIQLYIDYYSLWRIHGMYLHHGFQMRVSVDVVLMVVARSSSQTFFLAELLEGWKVFHRMLLAGNFAAPFSYFNKVHWDKNFRCCAVFIRIYGSYHYYKLNLHTLIRVAKMIRSFNRTEDANFYIVYIFTDCKSIDQMKLLVKPFTLTKHCPQEKAKYKHYKFAINMNESLHMNRYDKNGIFY